jgi:hypothetical protein
MTAAPEREPREAKSEPNVSPKLTKGPSKDILRRGSRKGAKKALRIKMKWEPFGVIFH